jgi:S-adenosylmethionine decarboxylase
VRCSLLNMHARGAAFIFEAALIPQEQPVLYSADFGDCQALSSFDGPGIAAVFAGALRGAGATVVEQVTHAFPEHGLTCVLVLRESHAVLHTWPETGTVNIDIFSCSTRLKSLAAIEELGRLLGARRVSVQEIPRADGHSRVPAAQTGV